MNAQHVGWDNLEVFLATARTGSFTGAAQRLGVNHATISRRVAKLEEELGARLFTRSQSGCEVTAAGEALMGHVETIEREVHAIGRKVAGRDQRLEGDVRIATVDDLAEFALPEIVRGFREQHPGVTVSVQIETRFTDLAKMHADIALRFGGRPENLDVVARKVAPTTMWMYASKEYLAANGVPRVPADLANHDIVRGGQHMATLSIERYMDENLNASQFALRSDSMLTRLAAVKAGVGLGYLSPFVVQSAPELVQIDLVLSEFQAWLWMVLHKDIRSNARVRAFADFAHERLVAMRESFI